jgi:predicted signal transduction protein with EAL and GGDEF domain
VARIGGDEFAVLLQSVDSHETAIDVAENLVGSLGKTFEADAIRLGASIGISLFPEHGCNASDLLKFADIAMYHAKASRTSSIQMYSAELAHAYQDKISMGNDLALAVSLNQLELFYQPQVDASSHKVTGVEALIRWNHPQRGQVSPVEFIPLAEKLGLITEIGSWVIQEACRQAALWHKNGLPDIRMAVNISSHQFASKRFVNVLLTALDESGVSPELFEIELTESLMLSDISSVVSRLKTIRGLGVEVAIDDFGTGYSSLQYLDVLPLDVLKIDRAFIIRLSEPGSETSLAQSISAIAKTLGLRTVAEGVETEEQLEKVIAIGCDVIQGYYYSKPVPAADIPDTVSRIDAIGLTSQKAA